MEHHSYEESKKLVYRGLIILGFVTLLEVFTSLFGKGYIVSGVEQYTWLVYLIGLSLILLSLYKAYYIIYEFMHMRYEVKTLAMSVLLPTILLIWGLIAFLWDGNTWGERRQELKYEEPMEYTQDQSDTKPAEEIEEQQH